MRRRDGREGSRRLDEFRYLIPRKKEKRDAGHDALSPYLLRTDSTPARQTGCWRPCMEGRCCQNSVNGEVESEVGGRGCFFTMRTRAKTIRDRTLAPSGQSKIHAETTEGMDGTRVSLSLREEQGRMSPFRKSGWCFGPVM